MNRSHSSLPLACLVLAALAIVQAATSAQNAPASSDLSSLFSEVAGLTQADLAELEAGRVVSRTETSPENLEALVTAAVKIRTTQDRTLAYFHQLVSYVDGQVTTAFGAFDRPPSEQNISRLNLDAADLADLRACQPATCDVRVGSATPADISRAVDWTAPDAAARASAWMRQGLVAYVADYLKRGDAALVGYDASGPLNLQNQWRSMGTRSRPLAVLAPDVQRYLSAFPSAAPPPGATEEIYWDRQHLTGLKPIVGVTHLVTWRDPSNPNRVIVVQKQIAASHYIYGGLAVTLILRDSQAPSPTTYVVYTNRSRGDLLKGSQTTNASGLRARVSNLSASLQRRVSEQLVKQSADRLLAAMKEALER